MAKAKDCLLVPLRLPNGNAHMDAAQETYLLSRCACLMAMLTWTQLKAVAQLRKRTSFGASHPPDALN